MMGGKGVPSIGEKEELDVGVAWGAVGPGWQVARLVHRHHQLVLQLREVQRQLQPQSLLPPPNTRLKRRWDLYAAEYLALCGGGEGRGAGEESRVGGEGGGAALAPRPRHHEHGGSG